MKNLSDSLVNGLQWKVVLLEKDEVSVKFSHIEKVIKLKAELFTNKYFFYTVEPLYYHENSIIITTVSIYPIVVTAIKN